MSRFTHRLLRTVCLLIPPAFVVGCTPLAPLDSIKSPALGVPTLAKNGVVLDVMFVRFPLGDAELNGPVWQEIDELCFATDVRRRAAGNGLRCGVISGPLPLKVEQLLDLQEHPSSTENSPKAVQLDQPAARQRQLRVRPGRRSEIIAMGESERVREMSLLLRSDAGQVTGRTLTDVKGIFAAKAFPQGDGGARLELTPELEHGTPQKRFVPGEGMFRVEFGPPHEVLDQLRIAADLAPGQMLALTALPDRVGSLGYRLFTETQGDATVQKMTIIRLAHSEHDDRFSDGPVLSENDDELKPLDVEVQVHETR